MPGYFIAVDRKERALVISFRGTSGAHDVLTDLLCDSVPIRPGSNTLAHSGMLDSAKKFVDDMTDAVADRLAALQHENNGQGYTLVLCGHSLGAAMATLVGTLWQQDQHAHSALFRALGQGGLRVYAMAPPAVLSLEAARAARPYITSVVVGSDIVPRLSLVTVQDLLSKLVALRASPELTLRDLRDRRPQRSPEDMQTNLYPAGEIYWFPRARLASGSGVRAADPAAFDKIILDTSMVSNHLAGKYYDAVKSLLG